MLLRDIAHSRTGDKGDTCNISVIAYRAEDWPLIRDRVTVERVADHLDRRWDGISSAMNCPNSAR